MHKRVVPHNGGQDTGMDATHDRLGRRDRLRPRSTGKRITPQARDLLWFARLLISTES